jgi:formylglycine-generating enzyme required for sulfatase activity
MSTRIEVEIGDRRRVFTTDDLPLSVGDRSCHVVLPGMVGEGPVAYLGHDRGDIFVQPSQSPTAALPVSCNGVLLSASRWLADGDELRFGQHRLRCELGDGTARLMLIEKPHRTAAESNPEDVRTSSPAAAPVLIAPVDFTPRWQSPPHKLRTGIRPRSLVLAAAAVLLVGGAWFVLTARAVRFETEPPSNHIELRGGWLKLGGSYLLRPGSYTVTAALDGYRSLSASITVDADTPPVVRFTLEPLGGLLTVRSRPVDGAAVSIDGVRLGATPMINIELAAGDHEVEVEAPFHLPHRTTIRFEPGDPPRELAVDLIPNWGAVTVSSSLPGTSVSVDGMAVGTTPLEVQVEAGERTVELRRAGFKPVSRRIRVTAGEPVDLGVVQLAPEDGRLAIVSEPGGALVTVDGVFRGSTPLELDVAPDAVHELRVSMAGHATYTSEVEVASTHRRVIRAELELLTGEVAVTSLPPGAELLVDGVLVGRTDRNLVLDARPHQIEVRLEGYVPFSSSITPEPGIGQAVHAVLKEEGPAGLPATIESPQGVKLVLVGSGRFTMGAARREPGRRANEVLHEVEITLPYYLAVREVTNREFREFSAGHLSGAFGGHNLEIDHHPVVQVSWEDAARYCNWLSERAGLPPVYTERGGTMVARSPLPLGFRLPTEAEWAWAARYPSSANARKYAWGDSLPIPTEGGNYGDAAAAGLFGGGVPGYGDGYAATAPAGSFLANPLGLYNIGGNVSEWVNDFYAVTPTNPGEVERDPTGPTQGAYHVIKGASWMDTNVTELRLSYRDYGDQPRPDVGFRIARSAR